MMPCSIAAGPRRRGRPAFRAPISSACTMRCPISSSRTSASATRTSTAGLAVAAGSRRRQACRRRRRRRHGVRLRRHRVPPGRRARHAARHPPAAAGKGRQARSVALLGRPRCAPPPRRPKAPSANSRSRRSNSSARTVSWSASNAARSTRSACRSPAREFVIRADLAFIAIGFAGPLAGPVKELDGKLKIDPRQPPLDQCGGQRSRLPHQRRQALCGGRRAARPVARGVGDPRGTPGRPRHRREPDGRDELPDSTLAGSAGGWDARRRSASCPAQLRRLRHRRGRLWKRRGGMPPQGVGPARLAGRPHPGPRARSSRRRAPSNRQGSLRRLPARRRHRPAGCRGR